MDSISIPLVNSTLVATIDADDAPKIAGLRFYVHRALNTVYARAFPNGKGIYLHQIIVGSKPGERIDHKDRDGLNNTKANLRYPITQTQNMGNAGFKPGATGFRGVCLHKPTGKYVAGLYRHGIRYHLGYFPSAEDAARAYDVAALQHFGEFATLNFPGECHATTH